MSRPGPRPTSTYCQYGFLARLGLVELSRLKLEDYEIKKVTFNKLHPELTRERSIRFLLFEIKRVFVYNSTIFKLTDLFTLYFFIQNVYANKKSIHDKRL